MLPAAIVIGGRVVGTWKRTLKKDKLIIEANPFTAFSNAENSAFTAGARRYGEYLNLSVEL